MFFDRRVWRPTLATVLRVELQAGAAAVLAALIHGDWPFAMAGTVAVFLAVVVVITCLVFGPPVVDLAHRLARFRGYKRGSVHVAPFTGEGISHAKHGVNTEGGEDAEP